jgi:hypothetical protein
MEVVVERCAGIDVHKDMVAVCVRVPGPGGERVAELAEFSTFTGDLLGLRDWLVAHGVTRVGMEATGVYWKPVFWVLEDAVGPSAGKSPPAKTAPLSSHHQSPPDPAKPHVRAPPRPLARLRMISL